MTRNIIFQLHLWCGLLIGLFLAFQGITGSFVAFRHAGNHWLHADEMLIEPVDAPFIPISQVLDSFSDMFPEIPHNVLSIYFPQAPNEAYSIRIWDNAPAPNKYASMNSYTGEITGSGSKYQYPFELMFRLHEQVSMGTPGINAVHAGGFLMTLMSLTGIYLWWPRRETVQQALRIKRKPLRRFLFGLHRVIGAYAFVLVFIVAFSGTMIFGVLSLIPLAQTGPSGFGMFATVGVSGEQLGEPVPVDDIIAIARTYFPNDNIRDLSYIRRVRAVCVVSLYDRDSPNVRALNRVFFERHTGKVLAVRDWDDLQGIRLYEDWAIPIHSGEVIGNAGRFLVMLSGLVMPFLFVTGAWLWWKKRQVETA
ncbi:MAG: PepSY-associated TM helix domain-containing protein [Rhodospirillaceae bacterium]|jgi:uncharacterized iron-regulated membrane protein|nr:PepSY-associated TM helix domain-containing protein [Rhodospirillaceae bacterium]